MDGDHKMSIDEGRNMKFSDEVVSIVRENIFEGAHKAIDQWNDFPWHTGPKGGCDSDKIHSSQALAVDVFGTLKVNSQKDAILNRLASQFGLPPGNGWQVELEYMNLANPLGELRLTQVDAVAKSDTSIIFFECKFTESDGGSCRQFPPILSGPNKGIVQCNGNYTMQCNPINNVEARCALSGKGIRYWDVVPNVFKIRNDEDLNPCPFRYFWYQWMRNLTNCYALAEASHLHPAFIIVFAEAVNLPMAQKVKSKSWANLRRSIRTDVIPFDTISYQELIGIACETDKGISAPWPMLSSWVENKIQKASAISIGNF